jgi:hypothetical protein
MLGALQSIRHLLEDKELKKVLLKNKDVKIMAPIDQDNLEEFC